MQQAKICGYSKRVYGGSMRGGLRGGALSNIKQLEQDFVKSMTFGKQEASKMDPAQIKKKFSI